MGVDLKIRNEYRFCGSTTKSQLSDPSDNLREVGDIFYCTDTQTTEVWNGIEWISLSSVSDLTSDRSTPKIKVVKCPNCGASLPVEKATENGVCTCSYCQSKIIVF